MLQFNSKGQPFSRKLMRLLKCGCLPTRGVAADRDSVPANLTPFVRCFPDTDICWTIDTIVHNGHITRFKMYTIDCADR